MAGHTDILDEPESLKRSVIGSVVFHLLLFGSFAAYAIYTKNTSQPFGTQDASRGSVGVTAVTSLPLARNSDRKNPVANDTKSDIPEEKPKPVEKKREVLPDPDAIVISRDKKKKRKPELEANNRKFFPKEEDTRPRLHTTVPQAASSPLYQDTPGSHGVGTGPASSLGVRFGAYEKLIRDRVGEKWRTGDVDARLNTAPPVDVTFDIQRDGTVRNIKVVQSSGNSALDFSAIRAVTEASPLPPLPPGFDRNSATVEFLFRLKR
jgi:protein TonB